MTIRMDKHFMLAKPESACLTIGVDEAGRGPLAGPVVAAAVVLGACYPEGLGDSKTLSAKRRAVLEGEIKASCRWAIGVVDVKKVDQINILQATMLAMTRAVAKLRIPATNDGIKVLVDGNMTPMGSCGDWIWPAQAIVGGDGLEPCISAASIIAKEHRDRLMRGLAEQYPNYGWDHNMGYGTAEHLAALRRYGATPHHRRSFAPVAQLELVL